MNFFDHDHADWWKEPKQLVVHQQRCCQCGAHVTLGNGGGRPIYRPCILTQERPDFLCAIHARDFPAETHSWPLPDSE
jgi:hypothetical protein